jgi:hypothetical protein
VTSRIAVVAALVASCASQSPRVEPRTAAKAGRPTLTAPDKPRPRLGWVSWLDAETLYGCDRRVDDNGNTLGVMGPCWKIGVDNVKHKMISWANAEAPDRSPANAGIWDKCRLVLEDARLVPPQAPARLVLESPSGRTTLDEWAPPSDVEGDAFQLEATFEPDGKRLGIVRLAIGLGEGERIVRIAGARLVDVPICDAPRD